MLLCLVIYQLSIVSQKGHFHQWALINHLLYLNVQNNSQDFQCRRENKWAWKSSKEPNVTDFQQELKRTKLLATIFNSPHFTTIQNSFFCQRPTQKHCVGNTCICCKCWMGNLFEECVSSQVRSIKRVITDYSEVNTPSRREGGLTVGCLRCTSLERVNCKHAIMQLGWWGARPSPMSPFPLSQFIFPVNFPMSIFPVHFPSSFSQPIFPFQYPHFHFPKHSLCLKNSHTTIQNC